MSRDGQRGQALIWTAIFLSLLFTLGGVVDLAHLVEVRVEAQQALDAAALAGAWGLEQDQSGGCGRVSACAQDALAAAARNGFPSATVQEVSGAEVVVRARPQVPTYFLKLVGIRRVTLSVAAAADAYTAPLDQCCSLLTLFGWEAHQGMVAQGVYAPGFARNATSFMVNGSGQLAVQGSIFVDGGILLNGMANTVSATGTFGTTSCRPLCGGSLNNGGSWSPSPAWSQPYVPDPLAPFLAGHAPDPSRLPDRGGQVIMGMKHVHHVLKPGYYPDGIVINGYRLKVDLEPGVYYLGGTGLTVNGADNTVYGQGVMLYLPQGFLTDNGSGDSWKLAAPTPAQLGCATCYAGMPAGILVWSGGIGAMTVNGGNGTRLTGTIYLPQAELVINGVNRSHVVHGDVVAQMLLVNGVNQEKVGPGSGSGEQPQVPQPRLVPPPPCGPGVSGC